MPVFAGASASRENGRYHGEPVVPESASLHSASGLNGPAATQELCSRPAQRLVTTVRGRCCFSRRRVFLAGFPRGSLGFCKGGRRRLSRGNTGLAGMASCVVAPGRLGGRDPAQRERHQRRGQGQQYRGQCERRGGGAKQVPAGAAQWLGGA
jgi:hypothetical protein